MQIFRTNRSVSRLPALAGFAGLAVLGATAPAAAAEIGFETGVAALLTPVALLLFALVFEAVRLSLRSLPPGNKGHLRFTQTRRR